MDESADRILSDEEGDDDSMDEEPVPQIEIIPEEPAKTKNVSKEIMKKARKRKSKSDVEPKVTYGISTSDIMKLAALKILSSVDKPNSNFKGLKRRLAEDKFWNDSFDQCARKWINIPIDKIGPEAALLISTGMVMAVTYAHNTNLISIEEVEVAPEVEEEEEQQQEQENNK